MSDVALSILLVLGVYAACWVGNELRGRHLSHQKAELFMRLNQALLDDLPGASSSSECTLDECDRVTPREDVVWSDTGSPWELPFCSVAHLEAHAEAASNAEATS